MAEGWIKLHRKILQSDMFYNEKLLKVFVWCLCKASHAKHMQIVGRQSVPLEPGQFVTGRLTAGPELNMPPSTAWDYLKLLERGGTINIKSNNKFSIVTVENWEVYQNDIKNPTTNEQQTNNKWTTNGQQMDTNKNGKNDNNDNKYINNNNKEEVASPLSIYQNNIYPMPGSIEIEGIKDWTNTLGNKLVIQAINIAAKNNARSWKYIERILIDWNSNGIKTLDQAKAYSRARGGKKSGSTRQDNANSKPKQEGEGEKLARRAIEKYGDKLEDFECDF